MGRKLQIATDTYLESYMYIKYWFITVAMNNHISIIITINEVSVTINIISLFIIITVNNSYHSY